MCSLTGGGGTDNGGHGISVGSSSGNTERTRRALALASQKKCRAISGKREGGRDTSILSSFASIFRGKNGEDEGMNRGSPSRAARIREIIRNCFNLDLKEVEIFIGYLNHRG